MMKPAFPRAALLALLSTALAGARPLPPPSGELTLDIADPVVAVTIAGVPLRLRVDLDQHDVVELNRAPLHACRCASKPAQPTPWGGWTRQAW